jgi:hypothetical protein
LVPARFLCKVATDWPGARSIQHLGFTMTDLQPGPLPPPPTVLSRQPGPLPPPITMDAAGPLPPPPNV